MGCHCHSAVSSLVDIFPFWSRAAIEAWKESGCHDADTVLWTVSFQFYCWFEAAILAQKERGCHGIVTVLWAVSSKFDCLDFRQQQWHWFWKRGVAMTLSQCCEQFHPSFTVLISGSNSGSEREGLPWHCHSAVSSSTLVLPFWFQAAIMAWKERGCHDIVTVLWAVPPQFYHFDFRQQ